eukprot:3650186-Rhodomonas_salina.5
MLALSQSSQLCFILHAMFCHTRRPAEIHGTHGTPDDAGQRQEGSFDVHEAQKVVRGEGVHDLVWFSMRACMLGSSVMVVRFPGVTIGVSVRASGIGRPAGKNDHQHSNTNYK